MCNQIETCINCGRSITETQSIMFDACCCEACQQEVDEKTDAMLEEMERMQHSAE